MNKLPYFPSTRLAVAIGSLVLASGQSLAEENHDSKSFAIEEIVVTAQKREQNLQDTPISITALSENMIENMGITNSKDLIGKIPGMGGYSAPGSRGTTTINIRGVTSGNPSNLSLDPAVGLYLDGVYVGKNVGSSMDVAEIERIEVLRGPQGTLYGRNSTAGAVNVISKKPTGEFGFRATGAIGNYDYRNIKANVDLPAIGEIGSGMGQLAASFGFQMRDRDHLYSNTNPGQSDFDDIDRQAWRLAISWMPSENFVADYSYDYSELDENTTIEKVVGYTPLDAAGNISRIMALQGTLFAAQGWAAIPGTDPRISSRWIPSLQETIAAYQAAEARGEGAVSRSSADFVPTAANETEGHALTLTWNAGNLGALGDVTFKSITAYREVDAYVFGDLEDIDSRLDQNGVGAMSDLVHLTLGSLYGPSSGFAYPFVSSFWDAIDNIGTNHSKQDTKSEYEQFSQELQMVGTTDSLEYVFGLYYFEDEANYDRAAIFAAPLNGTGTQRYETTTDALAIFGQGTWIPDQFDRRLALTLGIRYTEEDKDINYDYTQVITPFSFTPARMLNKDESFSNVSGSFTAAYKFTDDLNVFLRYATGYRSGGFNGEIFDNAFDEETIEQWELGVKSDWWNNRMRLNASIYTYTGEDLQVSQIKTEGGAATSLISNAGEADRWGAEIELTLAPIEDLILQLSYSYVNGDYDKLPDTCGTNIPVTCLDSGKFARRSQSPSNQLSFSGDYVFARTSIGDITGYVQVNWQDSWAETVLWTGVVGGEPVIYPFQEMDERTIVDARLSLNNIPVGDKSRLRVSLWGKNLTDNDYPTFSINFGGLGLITEQYGEPRTYGLEVSYDF